MLRAMMAMVFLWLGPIGAATADGKQRLNEFLEGLRTLEAGFEQLVLDTENKRSGRFHGVFRLLRPGRFRWDYAAPYEQSIIADGRDVWIVDADLEQITQQLQSRALRGTPALLLAEEVDIDAEFEVIGIGASQGLDWVELIPRSEDSQFVRILLAFDAQHLLRMEMSDKFGQVTRFRFFDVRRNPKLDVELFKFDKPPGYDLFEH